MASNLSLVNFNTFKNNEDFLLGNFSFFAAIIFPIFDDVFYSKVMLSIYLLFLLVVVNNMQHYDDFLWFIILIFVIINHSLLHCILCCIVYEH